LSCTSGEAFLYQLFTKGKEWLETDTMNIKPDLFFCSMGSRRMDTMKFRNFIAR